MFVKDDVIGEKLYKVIVYGFGMWDIFMILFIY